MANNDWQQGIPLERLEAITNLFDRYKPFSFGRFGTPNEAEIAQTIVQGEGYELFDTDNRTLIAFMVGKQAKRNSIKSTFATGQLFIQQHDFVIKHLTFANILSDELLKTWLQSLNSQTIWIETHTEDLDKLDQLKRLGFQDLGTKVSASSELKSVLFYGDKYPSRTNEPLATSEHATLERLSPNFASPEIIAQIKTELETYLFQSPDKGWSDHYSSYNLRKSWSAISLKGFTNDPHFIIKPAEMSKKWKEENASLLSNQVRDTPAFSAFPSVQTLLNLLGCETQRIRFMKVRASDGGLSRHADITDKEAGATIGRIARLHIPIQTNPECLFQAWQLNGTQLSKHLETGSLWYLDTRKPHAVSNRNGSQDRIHLVIDAVVNKQLQDWIYGKAARLI
jgi:hypothetical protein